MVVLTVLFTGQCILPYPLVAYNFGRRETHMLGYFVFGKEIH